MTTNEPDQRAQVGIGTLIVFIAMVVVAAVASGVLINAAGELQTKSADASAESSEQVSNRVGVVNVIGQDIDDANETVGSINVTVGLSPSAEEVDLSEATIQWIGPNGVYSLTHNSSTDGDGDFWVTVVKDDDASNPVLNSRSDRLSIDLDPDTLGGPLAAGSTVELRITTRSGATTLYTIEVPRSVSGESSVRL